MVGHEDEVSGLAELIEEHKLMRRGRVRAGWGDTEPGLRGHRGGEEGDKETDWTKEAKEAKETKDGEEGGK